MKTCSVNKVRTLVKKCTVRCKRVILAFLLLRCEAVCSAESSMNCIRKPRGKITRGNHGYLLPCAAVEIRSTALLRRIVHFRRGCFCFVGSFRWLQLRKCLLAVRRSGNARVMDCTVQCDSRLHIRAAST